MAASLRIALAQFDFPVGAVAENATRIAAMIAEARDGFGAQVVLFPELALSGYPPEDLLLRPSFLADCEAALQRIAADTQGIVAVVGWPQSAGAVVYNANCPTTRCSTSGAISTSIPMAKPACSPWATCPSA